jgi:hypothetical protein
MKEIAETTSCVGHGKHRTSAEFHQLRLVYIAEREPEIYALLGYYTASSGNPLPTFRDIVSVPSSRVKKIPFLDFLTLEDGTDRLSRNVGKRLRRCVINQKSADLITIAAEA